MPDFQIVSIADAKLQTSSGRRGESIHEYAGYIRQLTAGQAGKLHLFENEKLPTIRRRLVLAAQALGITLVIKRSGSELYFWSEGKAEQEPKRRNGRRRRHQEETATPDQPLIEPGFPASATSLTW